MKHPINRDYSDEQRLAFAETILCATDFSEMRACIDRWSCFVPFAPRPMSASEGEVCYVESLHDQLRQYAFEWVTNHRIEGLCATVLDLAARVEALESDESAR